jgi:hypothetical protein
MPTAMKDSRKGANPHKTTLPKIAPGKKFSIAPHTERDTPSPREQKIRQMKREAKQTPKIGSSPP